MKVTVSGLKITNVEAIKILREQGKSIVECQQFINSALQIKKHFIEKHSITMRIFEQIFNCSIEPFDQDELADLQIAEKRRIEDQKTQAAWDWINKHVSDEGKEYIEYLISKGGPGPARG